MNEEKDSLTKKLDSLNEEYYKKFWGLEQNRDAVPAPAFKYIQEVLYKQYVRDYELLMGEYGIETDKQIEELKIKRDKVLGKITLQYEKQAAALARAKDKLEKESALAAAIANAEHKMKLTQVVPDDLPKHWWQRWARPNYAKVLAQREVDIDVQEYFGEKENSIAELENRPAEIEELLREKIQCPRGRRARKRWEEDIAATAVILERKLRRREEAQEQLEEIIRAADEATNVEAFEEPQDNTEHQEPTDKEQPQKPKRIRTRRQTPNVEEEQNGQLAGQVGMDELEQVQFEQRGRECGDGQGEK